MLVDAPDRWFHGWSLVASVMTWSFKVKYGARSAPLSNEFGQPDRSPFDKRSPPTSRWNRSTRALMAGA